ncbi:hypothetical protein AYL99_11821 [Fonsecaea erecta]|uniref:Uncharacterized protein n=1 Tax=Fonsecaea erecta TaxID=1367422 RepID=A0A178Z350_9EURO|nr:hypothetical protein AYL99_11821 [Fonsecaea erecta]OAP53941.1 hypothetical protein AYL99_11821 [Fonsecaea erecta]
MRVEVVACMMCTTTLIIAYPIRSASMVVYMSQDARVPLFRITVCARCSSRLPRVDGDNVKVPMCIGVSMVHTWCAYKNGCEYMTTTLKVNSIGNAYVIEPLSTIEDDTTRSITIECLSRDTELSATPNVLMTEFTFEITLKTTSVTAGWYSTKNMATNTYNGESATICAVGRCLMCNGMIMSWLVDKREAAVLIRRSNTFALVWNIACSVCKMNQKTPVNPSAVSITHLVEFIADRAGCSPGRVTTACEGACIDVRTFMDMLPDGSAIMYLHMPDHGCAVMNFCGGRNYYTSGDTYDNRDSDSYTYESANGTMYGETYTA